MQNNKAVNFYAALAISIIVTIIIAGLVLLVAVISSQLSNHSYDSEFEVFIATSAIVLLLVLFFGLPLLLSSRYGWKTIVVTVIFQSILVFFAVTTIAALNTTTQPDKPVPYDVMM